MRLFRKITGMTPLLKKKKPKIRIKFTKSYKDFAPPEKD
jgi:hypothetical protein